jgi:hypothetical protein
MLRGRARVGAGGVVARRRGVVASPQPKPRRDSGVVVAFEAAQAAESRLEGLLTRGPLASRPEYEIELRLAEQAATEAWNAYADAAFAPLFGCDGTCGRDMHAMTIGDHVRAWMYRRRRV